MKYAACANADIDPVTGECSALVWVDQPDGVSSFPPAEALAPIVGAILTCLAIAYVLKLVHQWAMGL